jgi:tetratricopeptide (TPR) repeat protein
MEELKPATETPKPNPKTSTLAILSLIFAIIGICFFPLLLVSLILGIIGLFRISKNPAALTGKGLAVAGIAISAFALLITVALAAVILPDAISKIRDYRARINQPLKMDIESPWAYYCSGASNYSNGDFDKAMADYNNALQLDPNYALAYYGRGKIYYDQKEYDQAIADWEQAIKLDPSYEEELRPQIEEAKQAKENQ